MNDQQLLEVLATTNRYPATRPLPEGWAEDAPRFEHAAEGRDEMSTIDTTRTVQTEPTSPSSHRRWGAMAAIAMLVLAIAAIIVLRSDDPTDVADTPTTTAAGVQSNDRILAADATLEAFYSLDRNQLTGAAVDQLEPAQRTARILNAVVIDREPCQDVGTSDQVTCSVTAENDLTRAFGYTRTETLRMSFSQVEVVAVEWEGDDPAFIGDFWAWLLRELPGIHNNPTAPCFVLVTYASDHLAFEWDKGKSGDSITSGYVPGFDDDDSRCWPAVLDAIPEFIASDSYTGPVVP